MADADYYHSKIFRDACNAPFGTPIPVDPHAERKALEEALAYYAAFATHPGFSTWGSELIAVLEAARKHLETLPKPPRLVETWYVEYAYRGQPKLQVFTEREAAERRACTKRQQGRDFVRVTGPHMRQVPA